MRGANRPRNNAASSLRARIATLALLFFSAWALFSLFAGISYAANRPTQMWITLYNNIAGNYVLDENGGNSLYLRGGVEYQLSIIPFF